MPAEPIPVLLLPGLDGTGHLFARFLAAATGALDLRVIRYPPNRALGYPALASLVRKQLPREGRWALLGESFSGPLALRLAAEKPPGLTAVVLAASFHRRPARRWLAAFRPAAPLFFNAPLPAPAVRALLAGIDAPADLVSEVRAGWPRFPAGSWWLAPRKRSMWMPRARSPARGFRSWSSPDGTTASCAGPSRRRSWRSGRTRRCTCSMPPTSCCSGNRGAPWRS